MKCSKCGTKCKDNMRFCLNCGNPLSQPESKAEKKSKGSGRRAAVLSAVLAGSVLLGGGGIAADYFIKQGSIAPTVQQGNSLIDEKKYEEAVFSFDKALKLDPKNTDAYLGKAKALSGAGLYDLAEKALEEGLKSCGDDAGSMAKLTEYRTQLLDMKKADEAENAETAEASETDTMEAVTEEAETAATADAAETAETAETGESEAPEENDGPELKPVNKEYIRIDDYYPKSYTLNRVETGGYTTQTVENGEVVVKSYDVSGDGMERIASKIYRPIEDSVDEMYVAVSSEKMGMVWDYTRYYYYDEWHDMVCTERTDGNPPPGGASQWYECYDEEAKITAEIYLSDMDGFFLTLFEYDDHDNVISEKHYDLDAYHGYDNTELLRGHRTLRELTGLESHWGGVMGSSYNKVGDGELYLIDTKEKGQCLYVKKAQYESEKIYPMTVSSYADYTYEYSSNGDIISCVKSGEARRAFDENIEYTERTDNTYDSEGRLIQSVTKNSLDDCSIIHTCAYDSNGGLVKDITTYLTILDDGTFRISTTGTLRDGITDITIETVLVDGLLSHMKITKTQYGFSLSREEYYGDDSYRSSPMTDFVKGNADSIRVETDEYGLLTRVYKVDKSGRETDSVIIDYIRNEDGELTIQAVAVGDDAEVVKISGGILEYASYSYDDNGNPVGGAVYNDKDEMICTLNASYCKKDEVFK